jgi:hypothetical protein
MSHLREEELVEYFYTRDDAGAPAGRHVADCVECAEAYAALRTDLEEMEFAQPSARDADYGERVWESLAPKLQAYPAPRRHWLRSGFWMGLSYATACGLLVTSAFIAGTLWEKNQTHPVTATTSASSAPKEKVVLVVLGDHLDRSERLLVELKHADVDSAEMVSPLRDEAKSLLAANRVCLKSATQGDDPELKTALDNLNRLLDELANQPEGLNSAAIARLQSEMNSDGLLFEVRVLRSRIPEGQAVGTTGAGGGKI